MTKVDDFKAFVKKNPNLITYVRKGSTWQEFYELYDLYGEDSNVWDKYQEKEEVQSTNKEKKELSISNILNMAKNLDANKLEEGINSIQKMVSLFGDMLVKDKTSESSYTPRPIYRKFDD